MNIEDLKKLNKNKKLVKKMCAQYNAFIASESLIKTIPRVVGPHMNRCGKFPTAVAQGESLTNKVRTRIVATCTHVHPHITTHRTHRSTR